MHRAALTFCRLNGSYQLLDLPPPLAQSQLKEIIESGYTGLNVTIPHKQAALALVDELSIDAQCVQAVNTIRVQSDGSLIGHNTDLGGFFITLQKMMQAHDVSRDSSTDELRCSPVVTSQSSAIILGAGGAARAALWGLSRLGFSQAYVGARNFMQAKLLCDQFEQMADSMRSLMQVKPLSIEQAEQWPDSPVLINTTPIGLTIKEIPEWLQSVLVRMAARRYEPQPMRLVYDMVYDKSGSTLIVDKSRGLSLTATDGLPMLINQAALAFEYWTGVYISADVMASALEDHHQNRF
jgi:shikimate dehydrogenase